MRQLLLNNKNELFNVTKVMDLSIAFFIASYSRSCINYQQRRNSLSMKSKSRPRFKWREDMSGSHINRLKRDCNELQHYITKLKKQGRYDMVNKLSKKQQFLSSRIAEVEEAIAA
jgi:hypothetical protein